MGATSGLAQRELAVLIDEHTAVDSESDGGEQDQPGEEARQEAGEQGGDDQCADGTPSEVVRLVLHREEHHPGVRQLRAENVEPDDAQQHDDDGCEEAQRSDQEHAEERTEQQRERRH